MATDKRITDAQFRAAAHAEYGEEGRTEIDPDAAVSRNDSGDEGAYVQAWVWVENDDAALMSARDAEPFAGEGFTLHVDRRELAAVLAGLRALQVTKMTRRSQFDPKVEEIATDAGAVTPLSDDELDALVERLNT